MNKFGFAGRSRFNTFKPSYNTFAFNHFPVSRFHSSYGTFSRPNTFIVNSFSTVPNHFVTVRLPSHTAQGIGWNQLAAGQSSAAQSSFANEILAGGSAGTARVGYALAVADTGDMNEGVRAMRRAFEFDKDMVASLMMEDGMSEIVARVTRLYEQRMEAKGSNADDAFMLASLYQLQGDPELAMMAMDFAKKAADGQVSTTNLRQLIESEMSTLPMNHSKAWDLLASGENVKAAEKFVEEIGKDENAGAPKLGYALAIAAEGDLDKGTWALRRAFEVDPEGTSDVMLSGKLRKVVEGLTEKYVSNAENDGISKDNSYSLATLFMLQGDIEAAEMVVKNSPVDKDSYVVRMIVDEMKSQMTMMDVAMKKMEVPAEHSYDEFADFEETAAPGPIGNTMADTTIVIELPDSLRRLAQQQAEEKHFSNVSDYIQQLIRSDVEHLKNQEALGDSEMSNSVINDVQLNEPTFEPTVEPTVEGSLSPVENGGSGTKESMGSGTNESMEGSGSTELNNPFDAGAGSNGGGLNGGGSGSVAVPQSNGSGTTLPPSQGSGTR